MSVLEVYETAESLKQLKQQAPLPANVVRCLVVETFGTRPCEFRRGFVFTAMGVLRIGKDASASAAENSVRVNFYDEWARAASFMEKGDVIVLKGFALVTPRELPECTASSEAEQHGTTIVALARDSSLRVLQPEESGGTMEVTVTPENFESPHVRVLPQCDHSSRVLSGIQKNHASATAAA